MRRSISAAAVLFAAIPLSAALTGSASADTFTDSSISVGPEGLVIDAVSSSAAPDGSVRYTRDHLGVGPGGIVRTQTSATAGESRPGPLAPLTALLGGAR